jgi:hypothetical protein
MMSVDRQHPPGTCRQRQAEGLCRKCAAAFLGGGLTWFDQHARPGLPSIRVGGKVTFLVDDLRAWQHAHRTVPRGWVAPLDGFDSADATLEHEEIAERKRRAVRAEAIATRLRAKINSSGRSRRRG